MIGNAQAIIAWLFEQDKEKIFEIKEKKKKDGNAVAGTGFL